MTYLLSKTINKKIYYYLVKNVRVNGGWKKFTIYLGKGKISPQILHRLKSKYSKILESRVNDYLKSVDPLLSLITDKQAKELEKIRKLYKKAYQRLPSEVKEKYYEDFLTKFTYNTNAIEGSTVTLLETRLILIDRITPPGKTFLEVREVENHKRAFDFVLGYKGDLTKKFVLSVHRILTEGVLPKERSGVFRNVQVIIGGVDFLPPKPEAVEQEFRVLMNWYRKNKNRYHPATVASYFHAAFEAIHPFVDFNGRSGRLLLNFILLKKGFPLVNIKNRDRQRYYVALRAAQRGNLRPFVALVVKYLKEMGKTWL